MVTRLTVVVLAMRQKILRKPMKEKIEIDTGFEVVSIDEFDILFISEVCFLFARWWFLVT